MLCILVNYVNEILEPKQSIGPQVIHVQHEGHAFIFNGIFIIESFINDYQQIAGMSWE